MAAYQQLRLHAVTHSVASLRHVRVPPGKPLSLDKLKSQLYGSALLRFNFIYGDFIRWLSGEYTNCHRTWARVFNNFQAQPAPAYLPPADFARGFRIATEGVPLAGNYTHDIPSAAPLTSLAEMADITPLPPDWNPMTGLSQACDDPLYAPLSPNERACFLNLLISTVTGYYLLTSDRHLGALGPIRPHPHNL
jgi:hypothetical protein